MIRIKLLFRDLRFHPWIWGLSILGVAIGVSGWVGMQLATERASSAFRRSFGATVGEATHVVEDPSGALSETTYFRLARRTDWRMTPLLVEHARRSSPGREMLVRVVGVDPVTYSTVQSFGEGEGGPYLPVGPFVSGRPVVAVSEGFQPGLSAGDTLTLVVDGSAISYRVGVLLPDKKIGSHTVYMDLGRVQEDFGRRGQLTRILLRTPEDPSGTGSLLGPSLQVKSVGTSTRAVRSLIDSFRLNLRALALMALFVGAFLVYTSMSLYSDRQRRTFSLLRTLGMTGGDILFLAAGGIVVLGGTGTVMGLLLGTGLGQPVGDLITGTVDRLYVTLYHGGSAVDGWVYVTGLFMGGVVSLVGGFGPLLRNRNVPPRAWSRTEPEPDRKRDLYLYGGGGLLALIGALCLVRFTERSVVAGFAACFLVSLGGAIGSVLLVPAAARLSPPGLWDRFALRNLNRHRRRIRLVLASLVVAFSLVLAVSIMVSSFRTTVEQWVQQLFRADFYVKVAPESVIEAAPPLERRFLEEAGSIPGVDRVGTLARHRVLIGPDRPVTLRGIDPATWETSSPFRFRRVLSEPWDRFREGAVFLSQPGAYRLGVRAGDQLPMPGPSGGTVPVRVAGVFNDYTTFWALVYMDQDRLRAWYPEATVRDAAVFLGSGADADRVEQSLERLAERYGYVLRANRRLRREALENFDRTFAVTGVMQGVAGVVAVVGLVVMLMSFHRSRRRLFGLLSATGATRSQVARLVCEEGLILGILAFLGSIPTGILLGYLLIYVVNRRSFGWLIRFDVNPVELAWLGGLIGGSVLLSLVVPVIQIYRDELPDLLRERET